MRPTSREAHRRLPAGLTIEVSRRWRARRAWLARGSSETSAVCARTGAAIA